MWCITLIALWILKNPCIPGIKPTWSWCMVFFNMLLDMFARILLRIFASLSISDIGLYFSFSVEFLSGFGIRVPILYMLIPLTMSSALGSCHLHLSPSCTTNYIYEFIQVTQPSPLLNKHLSSNHTKPGTVWGFLESVQKGELHYHSWFTNEATRYTEKVNFPSMRVQSQWEPEIRPRHFDSRVHACYHYSADQAKLWQMILSLHSNVYTC